MSVIFGYTQNNNNAQTVVRATSGYRFYTSAAQRSIASSNASDTGSGTGAQTVTYTYYDNNLNGPFTDTVTLNGTSAVNTNATNIMFLQSMIVATTGTDNQNDGVITFFDNINGGGGTINCINAGDNSTYWAHYYVPAGGSAHVTSLSVSATFQTGSMAVFEYGSPLLAGVPQLNLSGTLRHDTILTSMQWGLSIPVTGPNFLFVVETPDSGTSFANLNNTVYATLEVMDK